MVFTYLQLKIINEQKGHLQELSKDKFNLGNSLFISKLKAFGYR